MKDEMKTNPSGDLISRANAIKAIASAEPKDNEYHYYKHIAIEILSEIPSIEVKPTQAEKCEDCIHNDTNKDKITCKECASIEQKTGEWISNHDGSWNCSECGLRVFIYAKGNYCPNCGARMYKGGGDE